MRQPSTPPSRKRTPSLAIGMIVTLVGVVTALLALFAAAIYSHEREQRYAALSSMLSISADQQEAALALPMWNFDAPQIETIMRSAMKNRELLAISATTNDKRLVLTRSLQGEVIATDTEPQTGNFPTQDRVVRHAGDSMGRLRMLATTTHLEQDLNALRLSLVGFIVALDITLVLSLSLLLWWFMVRPVRALHKFAASVTEGGTPDALPDTAAFHGELKSLRESLRTMIGLLDSRYRALNDSETRLKLATRAGSIAVWDWDVTHNTLVWDDEMYRQYGLRREDFSGTYEAWASALAPDELARMTEEIQAALRGERAFDTSFTIRRPDGTERVISGEALALRNEAGQATRLVGVNVDITDRVHAQAQVLRLNAELEQRVQERTAQLEAAMSALVQARDGAEAATRAKSEFLANMSHEIRTPMNAILGMTDLALRTELSPKQQAYLTQTKSAADSLLGVINDILDFSKIEAGKLTLESRPFALAAVLARVSSVVGIAAQAKDMQLHLHTAENVPAELLGDALRLEQVLINLCSNAIKFSAHGQSVDLSVHLSEAPAPSEQTALHFAVRDRGVGMNEAQMAHLFQPFNQLDASTTRLYGGTGLGLAICKHLVAMMGGSIGVHSQPGQGSEFYFTAQFGNVARSSTPAVLMAPDAPAQAPAALAGRRILLVEDNELNRMIATELLGDVALAVVSVVHHGQEAVDRVNTESFDAVLMDVQMPVMDGYQATRAIRQNPALARLPIIAMTAHAMPRDREQCLAAGMNDYVTKPFDPAELFAVLAKWLTRTPPAEPTSALSVAVGMRRCLGRVDLYERILRRYLEMRADGPAQISAALAEQDLARASCLAHSLISTAGTMGAETLSQTAREFQLAIDSAQTEHWPALLEALTQQHAMVIAAVEQHLERTAFSDRAPRP